MGLPPRGKYVHYPEMTMQRTTRRARSRGASALVRRVAAAVLALAAHGAVADAGLDLKLSLVQNSPHAPQIPPDLHIKATWPNACLPVVERSSMTPGHIDVHLRATAIRCTSMRTPLELRTNPARSSGWSQMPNGVYAVRLFLADNNGGEELVGFRWLDAASGPITSTPESGFWWSVAGSGSQPANALAGSGISLERQGDRIAVTLFGYEAGRPEWAFGSGVLQGSVARVQLVRMVSGGASFGLGSTSPIVEAAPALHLYFKTPARADAWIERDAANGGLAIELERIELARSAFTTEGPGSAWQGRWVFIDGSSNRANVVTLASAGTSDAESFRLLGGSGDVELGCRLDESLAAPATCTLSMNGAVAAKFDRVGLDRMQGRSTDGAMLELIRLPD